MKYLGFILLIMPFLWLMYTTWRKGYAKPMLQGIGIGLSVVGWVAFCVWLIASK